MIDSNTIAIALIGNPVKRSLSPRIQNYFIQEYNKNAVYLVSEITQNHLKEAFNGAKSLGYIGLNVTMPFKQKIYEMVEKVDDTASVTNSVNTVKFEKVSKGFNTDTFGFLKSLEDKNFDWKEKECLLIGAGGAARSAVYGILQKPIKKIYIYNRTQKRALKLLDIFKKIAKNRIELIPDISLLNNKVSYIDLIVNCTPVGMYIRGYKDLLPVPYKWNLKNKFIMDMVYNPVETNFIKKGKIEGATVIPGIDMLINQAAYSFKIWFDILPDINSIKNKLYRELLNINKNG